MFDMRVKKSLKYGEEADIAYEKEENRSPDIVYIKNAFMEINRIYKRPKEGGMISTHDLFVLRGVREFLRSAFTECTSSTRANYHLAITLPTHWDLKIREKVIRELFITSKLVRLTDHHDKLLFYSQLESDFCYLQSEANNKHYGINEKFVNGKRYMLCTLALMDNRQCIHLDLFTAHYPPATSTNDYFVPRLIKAIRFQINCKLKIDIDDIATCLKRHNIHTKLDILKQLMSDYENRVHPLFQNPKKHPWNEIFDVQPFEQSFLGTRAYKNDLIPPEVRLLTVKDIYKDKLVIMEKAFDEQMQCLCRYNSDGKPVSILNNLRETQCFEDILLLGFLKDWLIRYGKAHNYGLMSFGVSRSLCAKYSFERTMHGSVIEIKQQLKKSGIIREPIVIPGHQQVDCFSDNSKLSTIVNIDVLPKSIKFAYASVERNSHVRTSFKYNECIIQPLNYYFRKLDKYRRPELCITYSMKESIDNLFSSFKGHFADIRFMPNLMKELADNGSGVYHLLHRRFDLAEFFATPTAVLPNKDFPFCIAKDEITLPQPGYRLIFLVMYLSHIHKTTLISMNENLDNYWTHKNIGYVISVEKTILDNIFGSKELGGSIPSIIQQHIVDLDQKMKTYFIVAQLHDTHIQLTLHQIVRLLPTEENVNTIIVQEDIIEIENVNTALCKSMWNHMISKCEINYCHIHIKHRGKELHDGLSSFKNYTDTFQKLNVQLSQILTSNSTQDLYEEHTIGLSKECDCSTQLCLVDIIEFGFKPVMDIIVNIVADSLSNTERKFGNYDVKSVFMLGNIFELPFKSNIYKAYTLMLEREINISIRQKEKDTHVFVLEKSSSEMIQPLKNKKPYMLDSFFQGSLQQVSRYTYGIRVKNMIIRGPVKPFLSCKIGYGQKHVVDSNNILPILEEGQVIPISGLVRKLELEFSSRNGTKNRCDISLELFRISKGSFLDNHVKDYISNFNIFCEDQIQDFPISLEIKQCNHDLSIQFSTKMNGHEHVYDNNRTCIILDEQLTLAFT
ncbi:uncharacterized protein EV154DRAFT_562828 [Mucor mucedo]|uniref:uncharacterized protein n=1 Tax=Mucor mucedo TaxID=29922 RepID=UPI00221F889B|nr:uncharacterized protein EV154DRAFT_562828 [Mucor mucedo]KAI7891964.1 hypothetical protein EV154DRAFT_562828 [Mucor mucedo]